MDVEQMLEPWGLDVVEVAEVGHTPRASLAWWVSAPTGSYVAKLTFDRRPFVEPGLAIAELVAMRGVVTGRPVRTARGDLCSTAAVDGNDWTMALLARVRGAALQPARADADVIAGSLLGRVHAALADVPRQAVPANLLDWSAQFAADTSNASAARVVEEIAARGGDLSWSIVYGDPSPEILSSEEGPALIDWGTPSWGPRLHDVAAWLRWLGETPGAGSARERCFLTAYEAAVPLTDVDRSSVELFGRYGAAFGF